ncbi:hypothetical protein BDK51DRAFT_39278 [Blyttiomyces helicus]|uniref:Uncharacterized protein n=1 Tax=Blyttiomyces helicus TaxID=388810 RepID=A0A4P9W667_9FUNG|nr:hypothetical protein BDK51DRAFT_39278 [Blyttiomyces helicus]|eukprot:RKO87941.1 hypothetical protein BDK51DRAFT_39278 [Blyttiomyces helicus]
MLTLPPAPSYSEAVRRGERQRESVTATIQKIEAITDLKARTATAVNLARGRNPKGRPLPPERRRPPSFVTRPTSRTRTSSRQLTTCSGSTSVASRRAPSAGPSTSSTSTQPNSRTSRSSASPCASSSSPVPTHLPSSKRSRDTTLFERAYFDPLSPTNFKRYTNIRNEGESPHQIAHRLIAERPARACVFTENLPVLTKFQLCLPEQDRNAFPGHVETLRNGRVAAVAAGQDSTMADAAAGDA